MINNVFGWGYPAGAEHDPSAPWNQHDPEPVDVDVEYSVVMMRSITIETTDYDVEKWEECERDDDGHLVGVCGETYNYDNVNWRKEYSEQHLTPIELIDELKNICEKLINDKNFNIVTNERLQYLINECKDWDWDEEDVSKS